MKRIFPGVLAIVLAACGAPPLSPGVTASPTAASTPSETPAPTATNAPTPTPIVYPMHLEEIGHMGGDATALALSGDRLTVQTGRDHFIVVDVSDPRHPKQIGASHRVEGGISTIAAYKNLLLVGDDDGHLLAFDMTDAENPTTAARLDLGKPVVEMAIAGQYLYAATRTAAVPVIDLEAPGGPKQAGAAAAETGWARRVITAGNLLIVGSVVPGPEFTGTPPADQPFNSSIYSGAGVLHFFDISNPASPVLLKALPVHSWIEGERIQVVNHQLLIDDSQNRYDISDPGKPSLIGGIPFSFVDAIAGNYALTYNDCHFECPGHNQIFDSEAISGDEAPNAAFWASLGPLPVDIHSTLPRLAQAGHILFLADNNMLRVYDLSQPPTLIDRSRQEMPPYLDWPQIGSLDMDAGTRDLGSGMFPIPQPFCVQGPYLTTGLGLWSLADPARPAWLSKPPTESPSCGDFTTEDGSFSQPYGRKVIPDPQGYGSIEVGNSTLVYLNTGGADGPYKTDVYFTADIGRLVGVSGGRLYYLALDNLAAPAYTVLQIYDITDPYRPHLLGRSDPQPLFGQYDTFRIIDHYVVWEHRESAAVTIVMDVSDPAHITLGGSDAELAALDPLRSTAARGFVYSTFPQGYASDQIRIYQDGHLDAPLALFDLPVHEDPPMLGIQLQAADHWLYAHGVLLDVADPAHPRMTALSPVTPYQMGVYQDIFYFDQLNDGFSIYRLAPN